MSQRKGARILKQLLASMHYHSHSQVRDTKLSLTWGHFIQDDCNRYLKVSKEKTGKKEATVQDTG